MGYHFEYIGLLGVIILYGFILFVKPIFSLLCAIGNFCALRDLGIKKSGKIFIPIFGYITESKIYATLIHNKTGEHQDRTDFLALLSVVHIILFLVVTNFAILTAMGYNHSDEETMRAPTMFIVRFVMNTILVVISILIAKIKSDIIQETLGANKFGSFMYCLFLKSFTGFYVSNKLTDMRIKEKKLQQQMMQQKLKQQHYYDDYTQF